MRNEKCVTSGISEDMQSAYEPTVSNCLGRSTDTSDPGHFGTSAELSVRHFGTSLSE